MKKRFYDILQKSPKKNGWFLLFAAVLLSAGTAALTGCSVKDSPREASAVPNQAEHTDSSYGSPKLPQNTAEVQLYATVEAEAPTLEPTTTLAYIDHFDGKNLSYDEAEWVDVPSDRAKELGIEEQYLDSGFYVHNEVSDLKTLPVASGCSCTILDWYDSYASKEIDIEDLSAVLEERKETHIPYLLTVHEQKITSIVEHYVP